MSKGVKILFWILFSLILCCLFVFVGLFIKNKIDKKNQLPTNNGTALVRIFDGDKVYSSDVVKIGEEVKIPSSIGSLVDNQGNQYMGLTKDFKSLVGSRFIVTGDTDLYVVYVKSVQVIFTITNNGSTLNSTTFNVVIGSYINTTIPTLSDGKIWTIQWTESGSNVGLQMTDEEIMDFVVVEPIIFNCSD